MYKILVFYCYLIIFPILYAYAKSMPVIVIAPSKKPQSISTVGTSVTILDENFLKIQKKYF